MAAQHGFNLYRYCCCCLPSVVVVVFLVITCIFLYASALSWLEWLEASGLSYTLAHKYLHAHTYLRGNTRAHYLASFTFVFIRSWVIVFIHFSPPSCGTAYRCQQTHATHTYKPMYAYSLLLLLFAVASCGRLFSPLDLPASACHP